MNITNYNNIGDWFYLITAAVLIDFVVIVLAKYPGKSPTFRPAGISNRHFFKVNLSV